MNIRSHSSTRQSHRETWSLERLQLEHVVAPGASLERSTLKTYASAFHHFAKSMVSRSVRCPQLHSVYVSPHSANCGRIISIWDLCRDGGFWPDVREIRKSYLVTKTLAGCLKLHGVPPHRNRILCVSSAPFLLPIYMMTCHLWPLHSLVGTA